GFLPATFEVPAPKEGDALWPESVTLRLGREALTIEGSVLDPESKPAAGVRVWADDATFFGSANDSAANVEAVLAGSADPHWCYVETDAEGRFRLTGLLDREYRISSIDPKTLLRADAERVRAGATDAVIAFPAGALHERIAGRVVSGRGKPLAGIRVKPMCDAFQSRFRGETISTSHMTLPSTTTDAEGRFELKRVPKTLVYLRLDGEDIIPVEFGRHASVDLVTLAGGRLDHMEIRAPARCHFRVELKESDTATEFAVLDDAAKELTINVFQGNSRWESDRAPVSAGNSGVMAVAETAATVVLYAGTKELRRAPITLEAGQVTVLRP
ncbi:MAG TPA: hypothetical protein VKE69_02540, partial [Planctomycetota bacterium]|nr:hypothetical protein [Planctomycetota bacterium]